MFAIALSKETLPLVIALNNGILPVESNIPKPIFVYEDETTAGFFVSAHDFAPVAEEHDLAPMPIHLWTL